MSGLGLVQPARQELTGTWGGGWPQRAKEIVRLIQRVGVESRKLVKEIGEDQALQSLGTRQKHHWHRAVKLRTKAGGKGRGLLFQCSQDHMKIRSEDWRWIKSVTSHWVVKLWLYMVFLPTRESRMFSEPGMRWSVWSHLCKLDGGRIRGWVPVRLFCSQPALITACPPPPTLQQKENKKGRGGRERRRKRKNTKEI